MKNLAIATMFAVFLFVVGCDVQSGITQKSLEKYQPTPTPDKVTIPTEEPIDPADVIAADTASEKGPTILISRDEDKKNVNCSKYNRVMINGNGHEVKITGACSQIQVNGHRNTVVAAGSAEIITYGSNNSVEYSKYVNGKKPVITDSSGTNTFTKTAAPKTK
jgi:hypothetical protein